MRILDRIASFIVDITPMIICKWLWNLSLPLGIFAPPIFAKVVGAHEYNPFNSNEQTWKELQYGIDDENMP